MSDTFVIEDDASGEVVKVHHLTHDHRYIFAVRESDGRRFLGSGPIFGNMKASVSAMTLTGAAPAFAEEQARMAGLID